jgi:hypothetical protein
MFVMSLNVSAFNPSCIIGADLIQESGQLLQYQAPFMDPMFNMEAGFLLQMAGNELEDCFIEMDFDDAGNTNNININAVNINANSALIATNTTNIATNVASIAANSSLILANQQNISANTLNIESLFTNIDALTSSINSINKAIINQSTMLSKGIASSIAISNVGYSSDGWELGFGRGDFNNEHEHAFGLSYGSDKASFKVAYTRESTSLGFKVKLGN